MKRLKVFVITLLAVITFGGGAMLIFGNADAADGYVSFMAELQSMSDDTVKEDSVSEDIREVTETITIDIQPFLPKEEAEEEEIVEEELVEEIDYHAIYDGQPNTKVVDTANEGKFTISFAGDVLLDPGYSVFSSYKERGYDINQCISAEVLQKMRAADVMMINNEFPYSDQGSPLEGKTYTFRAATSSVSILNDLGVDIVSIANNHVYDYGETAFMDTLTTLENAGMPYVGAGRNIEDAARPYYYIVDGKKIAIIAASQIERYPNPDTKGATETSPGVFRCYDPAQLVEAIKKADAECDMVILYVHWGTESTDQLDGFQTSQAKDYVAAGVDIIIGDHPHVLQQIDYINGVPVVNSLGNYWFNSNRQDTCLLTLTINTEDASIDSLLFEPCLQSNMTVTLHHDQEKARVLDYMRSISPTASFDENGYVTAK